MRNGSCGKLGFSGLVLLTASLLWLSPAFGGGAINENFANNQYNTDLWGLLNLDQGTTAQIINNRLEVNVAGNGYAGLSSYGFTLTGDFEMQVDFTLINWPVDNGTQITLAPYTQSSGSLFQVGRAGTGAPNGQEQYFAIGLGNFYKTGVIGPVLSGTLRLVRTGNTMAGSYWNGTGWQSIGSGTDAKLGARVGVTMGIGPYGGNYSGIPAKAAFTNIRINYTILSPGFTYGTPAVPAVMQLLLS